MILVGTTIAPWKCDGRQDVAWLDYAEEMRAETKQQVGFMAVLEVDGRGLEPYGQVIERLDDLSGDYWRFAFDDGETVVESGNRLIRICMGRNLVQEYAMRRNQPENNISHILFLDSDISPPADAIPKLLELNRPVVGGHVPIYALGGPSLISDDDKRIRRVARRRFAFDDSTAGEQAYWDEQNYCNENPWVPAPEGYPAEALVQEHWNTAGFLMVRREVFTSVAWHYNLDKGLTDDPAYQAATAAKFGPTWVRHDIEGMHVPIPMVAVGERDGDRIRRAW